jgi:hypothetical protein
MPRYDGHEKRFIRRYRVGCITLLYKPPIFLGMGVSRIPRRSDVSDLSWRGVKFYTQHKLKVGTTIDVAFECMADSSLDASDFPTKAKVLWTEWSTRHKAWRTGAIFLDMREVQRDAILKMLEAAVAFDHRNRGDFEEL